MVMISKLRVIRGNFKRGLKTKSTAQAGRCLAYLPECRFNERRNCFTEANLPIYANSRIRVIELQGAQPFHLYRIFGRHMIRVEIRYRLYKAVVGALRSL